MYYIYMLRCEDNTIYTGITTDLERRMREHQGEDKKYAKYTHVHVPKKLESVWIAKDRKLASKLEYHIKKLKKEQKERLIQNHKLEEVLINRIDPNEYELVTKEKVK